MTTYSILGSLEVQFDGTTVSIARPRRRALLAYLILHANDRVDIDQLINALWDSEPPRTARAQIHTAVSALKAALPDALRADLKSENAGYRLNIGAESLDLSVFRHRAAMARADVAAAEFGPAAGRLRSALGLWRGPALANVEAPFVEPARARLEEERFSAYEALADLEMAAGRHSELVPLLTGLSDEYPTRESIVERLALALYRCGRKTDALAVVRRLRTVLAEEYGLDPAAAIVNLENAMLRGDVPEQRFHDASQPADSPTATSVPGPALPPSPPRTAWPRPAQLPRVTAGFVGRGSELARLDGLVNQDPDTARIAVVTGAAGIGKTSLVLLWAHAHAEAFPDGQLFVDLHGYDRLEAEPAEGVLERFLLALGIPGHEIPAGLAKREDLFRSTTAERRMLLVLDNARDRHQIRPLLPGSARCGTVITSRMRLGGLVADTGAVTLHLDVLPVEDSVEVLARIVGGQTVAGAPEAARELARLCGGLPLALRISAVRLLEEPATGIAGLAAELRPDDTRLGALDLLDGGHTVSQVLENSFRRLTPRQARLFRLLARHPVGEVSAAAAQALAGDGELRFEARADIRRLLRTLQVTHMVEQGAAERYRLHDLVRLFGRQAAEPADDPALVRLADWYIAVAAAGSAVLAPAQPRPALDVRHRLAASDAAPFADEAAALDWFDQEIANLVALLRMAAEDEDHRVVWQIAGTVAPYLMRRHRLDTLADTQRLGEQSALAVGNRPAAAMLANSLGIAYAMRRDPRAQEPFERAAAAYAAQGDRRRAARTTANLASLQYEFGNLVDAAETQRAAIEGLREFDRDQALSAALANLGLTLSDLGRHEEAQQLYAEAIAVAEECGADERAAYARGQSAWTFLRLGQTEKGLALSRAVLEFARAHGDWLLTGRMQDQVGIGLALQGAWPQAHAAWEEAWATLAGIDSPEAETVRARLRGEPGAVPSLGPDGRLISALRGR